jgi:hypothetical protein
MKGGISFSCPFDMPLQRRWKNVIFEDPCSKLQGIFDRKECGLFYDSLAHPAAIGGECARFRGSNSQSIVALGVF